MSANCTRVETPLEVRERWRAVADRGRRDGFKVHHLDRSHPRCLDICTAAVPAASSGTGKSGCYPTLFECLCRAEAPPAKAQASGWCLPGGVRPSGL